MGKDQDQRRYALCVEHGMAYHKRIEGGRYWCHLGRHQIELPPERSARGDRKSIQTMTNPAPAERG